jgi:hypothetical protein
MLAELIGAVSELRGVRRRPGCDRKVIDRSCPMGTEIAGLKKEPSGLHPTAPVSPGIGRSCQGLSLSSRSRRPSAYAAVTALAEAAGGVRNAIDRRLNTFIRLMAYVRSASSVLLNSDAATS